MHKFGTILFIYINKINTIGIYMNFNFSAKPEYDLNASLANEMIGLYGVLTKYLLTEKINKDDVVFGDYSHVKTDSNQVFEMYMLPEISEDWDTADTSFTNFGFTNFDNVSLFVSASSLAGVTDITKMIGDLIVFPNSKVMEITDRSLTEPGINNLFTHNDAKSVVKITCKPYEFKLIDEVAATDISVDDGPYETLDVYFQELMDDTVLQDEEATVTPQVNVNVNDTKVQKPIVDKSEDNIWGDY
jgi:hypothetical protein